jgi:hypothetical protein
MLERDHPFASRCRQRYSHPVPETVTIPRRFCGPANSANGGYACGVVAGLLGEPAECTLRAPPPLDVALAVERGGDGKIQLRQGELLVAEGVPAVVEVDVPAPVDFATAIVAARSYIGFERHPFPSCFVCGPQRGEGDGLRIFPGAVPERRVVAAPWIPDASLADANGTVRPEIVWSVLDCPSWFGASAFERFEGSAMLGRAHGSGGASTAVRGRPLRGHRLAARQRGSQGALWLGAAVRWRRGARPGQDDLDQACTQELAEGLALLRSPRCVR